MGKLDDKVAVVTGGTTGMGLAGARLFRDEGAAVYLTGRRRAQLDAAVEELGATATGVQADSADLDYLDDLDRLIDTVRTAHGRIDVLWINAGIGYPVEPLSEVTPDRFDEVFGVNVRGALFTAQKALELMPDGSTIILTGSISAYQGVPGQPVYSATKAAVRSFARTWAVDLAPRRIRVNVLDPGPIRTPAVAELPAELNDWTMARTPAGRWAEPEEVATVALFLACDDSSFVNASAVFADGGLAQI